MESFLSSTSIESIVKLALSGFIYLFIMLYMNKMPLIKGDMSWFEKHKLGYQQSTPGNKMYAKLAIILTIALIAVVIFF